MKHTRARGLFSLGSAAALKNSYVAAAVLCLLVGVFVSGYSLLHVLVDSRRAPADFLAACRALNLVSGVSPLLPLTLLCISFGVLAFVQLRRYAYYDDRYPAMPDLQGDQFCPTLGQTVYKLRDCAHSFSIHPIHSLAFVALLAAVLCGAGRSQQTLEGSHLDRLIIWFCLLAGFFLLFVWIRLLLIWRHFSEFLQEMERHPLRNVFSLLPRGFVWSPVWQGGGKKRTHVTITRSLECALALLAHSATPADLKAKLQGRVDLFKVQVSALLRASADAHRLTRRQYRALEENLSEIATEVAVFLRSKTWSMGSYELRAELAKREDTRDALHLEASQYREVEPEFICGELLSFRFLSLINYIWWQLDNLVGYLSFGFLMLALALASYDFRSRTIIEWTLVFLFVVLTAGIVSVFAQADRDAILSRITGTEEGKLDRHFVSHLLSFGAMPVLILVATHFPTVGKFVFSWVKPALEAIH